MTDKPVVKCGTRRHFRSYYPELREAHETDEDGTPGLCTAIKPDKLPYAWRYATREVMQSWSLTEIYCAAHEPIPPTDSTPKEESAP
jgi:hypothetical protein